MTMWNNIRTKEKRNIKTYTTKVRHFCGVINVMCVYNLPSIIEKLFEEAVYFFVR